MLRYKCLVLDHDDTVVQSEATVNYPCFCRYLEKFRPGVNYSVQEYVSDCNKMPFVDMCKTRFQLTDEEMYEEYLFWQAYVKEHIPDPFPGIKELLYAYRNAGGIICVVSMSSEETILRDYRAHFGLEPDRIFSCDLPAEHRKPSPWSLEQIKEQFKLASEELLVLDDMKFAVSMARAAKCPVAFAGWGRQEFPSICEEMESLCDYKFYSTKELEKFLFD